MCLQRGTSKGLIQEEVNLGHMPSMPSMNATFLRERTSFFKAIFKNLIKTVKQISSYGRISLFIPLNAHLRLNPELRKIEGKW